MMAPGLNFPILKVDVPGGYKEDIGEDSRRLTNLCQGAECRDRGYW